jgi:hypothetical protein
MLVPVILRRSNVVQPSGIRVGNAPEVLAIAPKLESSSAVNGTGKSVRDVKSEGVPHLRSELNLERIVVRVGLVASQANRIESQVGHNGVVTAGNGVID